MSHPVHAVVLHRFPAPAGRFFDACLDPAWVGRWMLGPGERDETVVRLALEARVGGRFSFVVNRRGAEIHHCGEYLAIDRPRLLVFTWAMRDSLPDASRVVIEIDPRDDQGCAVKVTHVLGAGWSAHVDRAASAWSQLLDALERSIATPAAA